MLLLGWVVNTLHSPYLREPERYFSKYYSFQFSVPDFFLMLGLGNVIPKRKQGLMDYKRILGFVFGVGFFFLNEPIS